MDKERITLELYVSNQELERWTKMADILCLNIYEYIRRCASAHTTILEMNSFDTIRDKEYMERYHKETK